MPRYVVALVAVGLAGTVLGSGVATADPVVPDPALVDPAQAVPVQIVDPAQAVPVQIVDAPLPVTDPFVIASQQSKADPAGALASLLTGSGGVSAVGQGVGLSMPSAVNPLADVSSLMAHNYRMPSGDEASPYVLQSDVAPGPFARVDAFKGLHAMLHGSLGRMPGSELGQPLPGTAPPPGTAIPAGIEQFMAPPAEAVAPVGAPPIILPEG